MSAIDVAIVGCGNVAYDHMKAWQKIPLFNVVATCDTNEKALDQFTKRWNVRRTYQDFSRLLKQENCSLIDICTPPQTHMKLGVQAMDAGCHVIFEKPLAIRAAEAESILRSRDHYGVRATTVHNLLFEPSFLGLCSIANTKQMGDIHRVEIDMLHTSKDPMSNDRKHWCHAMPGERFGEMLPHPIYMLQKFLNDLEVKNVEPLKISSRPWMKYDELHVTLRGSKGIGVSYTSFNSSRDAVIVTLFGNKLVVRIDLITGTLETLRPLDMGDRIGKGRDVLSRVLNLSTSLAENSWRVVSGRWKSGLQTFLRLATNSIMNDEQMPVTLEEAYETTRITEEVCERINHCAQ